MRHEGVKADRCANHAQRFPKRARRLITLTALWRRKEEIRLGIAPGRHLRELPRQRSVKIHPSGHAVLGIAVRSNRELLALEVHV